MNTESFTELIIMKNSRKKPIEGDIFILQPKENLFMYGKVIQANISSKNPLMDEGHLVYIYKNQSNHKVFPDVLDLNDLLFPPVVTNQLGWLKGYFETIGNGKITNEELSINFGYWHSTSKKFYDLHGEVLKEQPLQWKGAGLTSYGGIGRAIHRIFRGEPHLYKKGANKMGAWGTGVMDDDLALDIKAEFEDAVNEGLDVPQATARVFEAFGDVREDEDEGPILYLVLAQLQLQNKNQ